MLHDAQGRPRAPHLEQCPTLEGDRDVVRPQELDRASREIVTPVEIRALQLRHHPDPAAGELEHLLEGWDPDFA